jgi:hypothetical protein
MAYKDESGKWQMEFADVSWVQSHPYVVAKAFGGHIVAMKTATFIKRGEWNALICTRETREDAEQFVKTCEETDSKLSESEMRSTGTRPTVP